MWRRRRRKRRRNKKKRREERGIEEGRGRRDGGQGEWCGTLVKPEGPVTYTIY